MKNILSFGSLASLAMVLVLASSCGTEDRGLQRGAVRAPEHGQGAVRAPEKLTRAQYDAAIASRDPRRIDDLVQYFVSASENDVATARPLRSDAQPIYANRVRHNDPANAKGSYEFRLQLMNDRTFVANLRVFDKARKVLGDHTVRGAWSSKENHVTLWHADARAHTSIIMKAQVTLAGDEPVLRVSFSKELPATDGGATVKLAKRQLTLRYQPSQN